MTFPGNDVLHFINPTNLRLIHIACFVKTIVVSKSGFITIYSDSTFAQVSLSPTVRLKTILSGVVSLSTQKYPIL